MYPKEDKRLDMENDVPHKNNVILLYLQDLAL